MSSARTSVILGHIVMTPGAAESFNRTGEDYLQYLTRFSSGDWGQVEHEDHQVNNSALSRGGPILGEYSLKDRTLIWIYNEADSGSASGGLPGRITTIMLPDEW